MRHYIDAMAKALLLFVLIASVAPAQVRFAGGKVQIHGFFSQGYAKSSQNNYLTMETSEGSAAMTDGGLNIGWRATDNLRFSAQVYSRNIGQLSNGRVELDFAFADYRLKDWLGFRAGKVKTALGLYNDVQDMEFLHTFALLPQSIYSTDLRASTIAHVGGDLYGDIRLKRSGTLSYTLHAGRRPDDDRGGYQYGLADSGMPFTEPIVGWTKGADLRWATPVPGLVIGTSWFDAHHHGAGMMKGAYGTAPFSYDSNFDRTSQHYVEYQKGSVRLMGEYRRNYANQSIFLSGRHFMNSTYDFRAWYFGGAWRLHKRLEVGSYHSRAIPDWASDRSKPSKHMYDSVVTARVDINRWWNVKVEGHFMDGYGSVQAARGFYRRVNPNGFQPTTQMLLIRTGFNF